MGRTRDTNTTAVSQTRFVLALAVICLFGLSPIRLALGQQVREPASPVEEEKEPKTDTAVKDLEDSLTTMSRHAEWSGSN